MNTEDEPDDTRTRIVSWDARSGSIASIDDNIIDEEAAPEEKKDDFELQPIWSEKKKRRGEPDDEFMAIPLNVNDVVSEETIEQASKLAKMGINNSITLHTYTNINILLL